MNLSLPHKVRAVLYVLTGIGTPIVAYLFAMDIIGQHEVTLWSSEVTIVSTMAALNIAKSSEDRR